jgi:hypothetical protein
VGAYNQGVHTRSTNPRANNDQDEHAGGIGGGISIFTDGIAGFEHPTSPSANNLIEGNTAKSDQPPHRGFGRGPFWCETYSGSAPRTIDNHGQHRARSTRRRPSDGGGIAAWTYPAVEPPRDRNHVTEASNVVTQNHAADSPAEVLELFLLRLRAAGGPPSPAEGQRARLYTTITRTTTIHRRERRRGGIMAIFESDQTFGAGAEDADPTGTPSHGNSGHAPPAGGVSHVGRRRRRAAGRAPDRPPTTSSIQFPAHNAIVNTTMPSTTENSRPPVGAGDLRPASPHRGTSPASPGHSTSTRSSTTTPDIRRGREVELEAEYRFRH